MIPIAHSRKADPFAELKDRNVALFTTSLSGGGAESHFSRLVEEGLAGEARCRVVVCLASTCPPAIGDAPVISLGWNSKLDYPRAIWRLVRLIRVHQIGVLCAFERPANLVACTAALLCGRRVFCAITIFNNLVRLRLLERDWFSRLRTRLEYWAYRRGDLIWANSRDSAEHLERHCGGPDREVRLVRNPIPVERIAKRASEIRSSRRSCQRTILGVGRLSPEKRFEDLISAFHLVASVHRDCDLLLVGDGPERKNLVDLARELGLVDRIRFEGWHDDPLRFYATCDVLAVTSETEGNPNVLLEGMAAGTPIIATRCTSWVDEFADRGAVIAVPVGDVHGLAQGISELLVDPLQRMRIAERGLALVQDFETSKAIKSQNADLTDALKACGF